MAFLEKIKSHLTSNDLLIQETVLHALHDFPYIPEEWTVELLMEAFNNNEKLSSILIYIENQTFNEEAIKVLIENIPKMDRTKVHLGLKLLNRIEPELALTYSKQLAKYISKDKWKVLELVVIGSKEEVIKEYVNTLAVLEQTEYYSHKSYSKAKKLAACMVKNGWITEDELDRSIRRDLSEQWFSYNGILSIYMIGLLRMEKYIPILATLLARDEDILLEEVASALILFQSDEVVKAVEPYLRKSESVIFATSVLENIKSEHAIQVLRDAYRHANEIENQDMIIEALCHQFTIEAMPEITEHMKKEYFSSLVDIEHTAYSYFSIIGELHSDLEKWRNGVLEREMNFQIAKKESIIPSNPVQKENKVGRNDPCPCGSGKKFKKCCGK